MVKTKKTDFQNKRGLEEENLLRELDNYLYILEETGRDEQVLAKMLQVCKKMEGVAENEGPAHMAALASRFVAAVDLMSAGKIVDTKVLLGLIRSGVDVLKVILRSQKAGKIKGEKQAKDIQARFDAKLKQLKPREPLSLFELLQMFRIEANEILEKFQSSLTDLSLDRSSGASLKTIQDRIKALRTAAKNVKAVQFNLSLIDSMEEVITDVIKNKKETTDDHISFFQEGLLKLKTLLLDIEKRTVADHGLFLEKAKKLISGNAHPTIETSGTIKPVDGLDLTHSGESKAQVEAPTEHIDVVLPGEINLQDEQDDTETKEIEAYDFDALESEAEDYEEDIIGSGIENLEDAEKVVVETLNEKVDSGQEEPETGAEHFKTEKQEDIFMKSSEEIPEPAIMELEELLIDEEKERLEKEKAPVEPISEEKPEAIASEDQSELDEEELADLMIDSDVEIANEVLNFFKSEGAGFVDAIKHYLASLVEADDVGIRKAYREIGRKAHSFKESGKMLQFADLVAIASTVEGESEKLKKKTARISNEIIAAYKTACREILRLTSKLESSAGKDFEAVEKVKQAFSIVPILSLTDEPESEELSFYEQEDRIDSRGDFVSYIEEFERLDEESTESEAEEVAGEGEPGVIPKGETVISQKEDSATIQKKAAQDSQQQEGKEIVTSLKEMLADFEEIEKASDKESEKYVKVDREKLSKLVKLTQDLVETRKNIDMLTEKVRQELEDLLL